MANQVSEISSLATLSGHAAPADEAMLRQMVPVLFVLPQTCPVGLPYHAQLKARLKRARTNYADLANRPLSADLPHGEMAVWVVLHAAMSAFERHTALRKALTLLLQDSPEKLIIALYGAEAERAMVAPDALYCAWINGTPLPTRKRNSEARALKKVILYGHAGADDHAIARARAAGNLLARHLTERPANALTPAIYRDCVRDLAKQYGWKYQEYDLDKLRRLGAGAFIAVAQGSDAQDAAIVHLRYAPAKAKKTLALVGKGICFDTGGHNLKPARYMHGMHEDMNGSAVALGVLLAATLAKLPLRIDCWLALAQNHISPQAYKQNDVVTALNGTTIEIVHTDAEGRMVLADTLTLASREKPHWLLDFATLTGSMTVALGNRMSGVLGTSPEFVCQALGAGRMAGERLCAFPLDADYDEDLDSKIADIKQCTLEAEADHVLAARFLSKFIDNAVPWLHVDLSSSNRKGGLGAVAADVNGFGVGFGLQLARQLAEDK